MAFTAMGGGGGSVNAGPSFPTSQVGTVRSYTPQSYNATVSAGGARGTVTNPSQAAPKVTARPTGAAPAPAGVKPNGYVPTYARYGTLVPTTAAPAASIATTAATPASAPQLTRPSASNPAMAPAGASGYTPGAGGYFTAATGLSPYSSASQFRNAGVHLFQLPQQGPLEGGYYDAFNNALQQSMKGYADIAGQNFQQDVGKMLGGLNSIGALRSGAVVADTNNLMKTYAGNVSDYASQLATQAAQLGLTADEQNQLIQQAQQQFDLKRKDANNQAIAQAVGGLLGAVPKIASLGIFGGAAAGAAGATQYANAGANG